MQPFTPPFIPPDLPHPALRPPSGKAYLVGAGPGDPQLLTLKAKWVLENADVILYDYLVDQRMMHITQWQNAKAEWVYVGKSGITGHTLPQEGIEHVMVDYCKQGKIVCRLKGGDPYVFGRGGEEAQTLRQAGIPFEVVPGITSAVAVPAYAGIPVTHRDHVSSFTVLTGHEDPTKPESNLDWAHIAESPGTLVFLMGVKQLPNICEQLQRHGKSKDLPVALIEWGTRPQQRTVTGTLETIVENSQKAGLKPPCVTIIGDVVTLQPELNWFETLPLFGKTIVITRAREQASSLRTQLEQLGARVIEFPTIHIEPNLNRDEIQPYLSQLQSYNWLIFTSPNAVSLFIARLYETGQDVRALAKTRIAAIGPATAEALEAIGIRPDLLPPKFVAESLFEALSNIAPLAGQRFLMPRADIARDMLPKALENAGAIVDTMPLYFTQLPETDSDTIEALVKELQAGTVDAVTFSSSSTAANFAQCLEMPLKETPDLLKNTLLCSIGPITSDTMQNTLGRVDIEASVYTIPGLISALLYAQDTQLMHQVSC
jgi:uroporphyrinogen III methyltransferase / synthase